MLKRLATRLRRFRREDEGSIVAEVVIMFPMLFAATIAIFVFFDAFRNQSINLKANYTIADSLSRETNYITSQYMTNTWRLHRFLTNSPSLTQLRVSVIVYDAANDEHTVAWTRIKGGSGDYENKSLSDIGLSASQVPEMPDNDTLIVVQTSVDYVPNFSIGVETFTFQNTTFTRPRWAPNLCFRHSETTGNVYCPLNSV